MFQGNCRSQCLLEADGQQYKMSVCVLDTQRIQLRAWSLWQCPVQIHIRRSKDLCLKGQGPVLESQESTLKGLRICARRLKGLNWKPGNNDQNEDENQCSPEERKQLEPFEEKLPKLLQRKAVTMKLLQGKSTKSFPAILFFYCPT